MPIFLKHKVVFIHIPKTGGTSVTKAFEDTGDRGLLRNRLLPRQQAPLDHLSYCEMEQIMVLPDDFTLIAVVRNPYDRFLSEYFWCLKHRKYKGDMESFAGRFFTGTKWDNHNLTQCSFISERTGRISARIKLIRFETLAETFTTMFGLALPHVNSSDRTEKKITKRVKRKIEKYWKEDFLHLGYQIDNK